MAGLAPSGVTKSSAFVVSSERSGLGSALPALDRNISFKKCNWLQVSSSNGVAARKKCFSSGQTQTLPRGSPSATKAPVKEVRSGPKLDDAGPVFPPRYDGGGGGGGGGGGSSSSGGFFLFGMLLLLSFLKDLEKKWIAGRVDRPDENEKELQL